MPFIADMTDSAGKHSCELKHNRNPRVIGGYVSVFADAAAQLKKYGTKDVSLKDT